MAEALACSGVGASVIEARGSVVRQVQAWWVLRVGEEVGWTSGDRLDDEVTPSAHQA